MINKSNCPLAGTNCEEITVCQIMDCPFWAKRKIAELKKWNQKYTKQIKEG